MTNIDCGCAKLGYRSDMSFEELRDIIEKKGTCQSRWICGNIDKLLRRADAERTRQKYYSKRKKREGYSDEEINVGRKQRFAKVDEVDLDAVMCFA